MSTEIRIPPIERHGSPEAHSTVNVAGSTLIMGFFAAVSVGALCFSIYAIGRAEAAGERARLAERETRIMEADFQYVRAWVTARGVYLPANHEEAEERPRVPSHYPERPIDAITVATGPRARGEHEDGVLVPGGPR